MTKIVASCPHCFNTLANEYPDFGGRYEVMHHSELLAELVRDGRLAPAARRRDDHVPRLLLPRASQRRAGRAARARRRASGGRSRWRGAASARSAAAPAARTCGWRSAASQINEERAREAAATGADTLAVACPFCTVMLDDGVRQTGGEMRVADVSTLLARERRESVTSYDYVIVGGGSAGCVLANRLSADPGTRVLVARGRTHRTRGGTSTSTCRRPSPFRSVTAGYDWRYASEPEPFMGGRRVSHARGKVLGGSSSINGMIFQRGNALDYEKWAAEPGLERWSYAHCLPYFKRMETCVAGADDYRGGAAARPRARPRDERALRGVPGGDAGRRATSARPT